MKNLILTVTMFLASLAVNAQGIITVATKKSGVPIEQWYVIRDKDFNNYSFFYAKHDVAREVLTDILNKDNQSIEFPKGIDEDGDQYWIIYYENEFTSYFYLSKDGDSEFSNITSITK
jgi:hypothetical protein